MDEKKTIQFNPDLFNFSTNKTRKKRQSHTNANEIKLKSQTNAKSKLDTLKKRSILKMIREHQEKNYKKILEHETTPEKKKANESNYQEHFMSNFDNSKQFLDNLVKEKEKKQSLNSLNNTLKRYTTQTNSLLYNNVINPSSISQVSVPVPIEAVAKGINKVTNIPDFPAPKYGCLKGGSLPTYKQWLNKTQNSYSKPIVITNTSPLINPMSAVNNTNNISSMNSNKEVINRMSEIKQTMEKLQVMKIANNKQKRKRKKTVRRTYKTGKSKTKPKISVLISNRTIRNNITTNAQLLKQTPMQEIKKCLIKRGLIKIGSIAPNDVLRKMYESVVLICGEVQNHNPDNLLYNFLNSE
jgi:hypothetical protein